MKSAIVTGAGGFIGGALVEKLLAQGVCVVAVDIDKQQLIRRFQHPNINFVQASFDDYSHLDELIHCSADVFYHFAWQGVSGVDYRNIAVQEKNVFSSRIALEQAIKLQCSKFIYLGSSHEYLISENSVDQTYTECSVYGAAKHMGEIWCRTLAKDKIIFSSALFTNVFGVGDRSNRSTNTFISQLLDGKDLNLTEGSHLHDWTYIEDAVNGLIAIAERGKNGRQYYIGNRKLKKFAEIIHEVRDIVNPNCKLLFGTYPDYSFVDYSKINLEILYEDTGFKCLDDFKDSIIKTMNWIKYMNGK